MFFLRKYPRSSAHEPTPRIFPCGSMTINVGVETMPNFWATALSQPFPSKITGYSKLFSFTNDRSAFSSRSRLTERNWTPLGLKAAATFFMLPVSARHAGHQVAQKYKTRCEPPNCSSTYSLPYKSLPRNVGADADSSAMAEGIETPVTNNASITMRSPLMDWKRLMTTQTPWHCGLYRYPGNTSSEAVFPVMTQSPAAFG